MTTGKDLARTFPQFRTITIHAAGAPAQTLDDGATLDGAAVVPGFTALVSLIFG